jgi:hypothetical protein
MEIAKLVLEFARVLLAWPVITLIFGVVFLRLFKPQIGSALARILSVRLPGGGELLMSEQQASVNVLTASTDASAGAAPGQPTIPPAPTAPQLPAGGDNVEQRVQTERQRAQLWEYRFLNLYLVPRTQVVLDWLASQPPMGLHTYEAWLMGSVPSPTERLAVLDALLNHHLVEMRDNLITVTHKGREYMQWRGPAADFLRNRLGPAATATPSTGGLAITGHPPTVVQAPSSTPAPQAEPKKEE